MLLDQYGKPMQTASTNAVSTVRRAVRGRYDAERSVELHWAGADSLSANSSNTYAVRKRLRERSRYEVANNSYARGIVNSLANFTIGSGPTLQVTYCGRQDDPTVDMDAIRSAIKDVERKWRDWAYVRQLNRKIHTMCLANIVDGEGFARFVTSPKANMITQSNLTSGVMRLITLTTYQRWVSVQMIPVSELIPRVSFSVRIH